MLAGILAGARRHNEAAGITGALVCRRDIYLQLIEGPADALDPLFARIRADDRHNDVVLLARGEQPDRLFPGWAMLDDPARSWLWSPAEVAAGAARRASPLAARAIFSRLAREVG